MSYKDFYALSRKLFLLSENRGRESCGFYLSCGDDSYLAKHPFPASDLVSTAEFKSAIRIFFEKYLKSNRQFHLFILGHSRLVTDGDQSDHNNNQPLVKNQYCCIHNGIIINADDLFDKYDLTRSASVDTEVILELLNKYQKEGHDQKDSIKRIFAEIKGSASIAFYREKSKRIFLATNTGSLYAFLNKHRRIGVFASERYICEKIINSFCHRSLFKNGQLQHIEAFSGMSISSEELSADIFQLPSPKYDGLKTPGKAAKVQQCARGVRLPSKRIIDFKLPELKRCSRCILPETVPFIEFDDNGVCNYCHNHQKLGIAGPEALEKYVRRFKHLRGDSPDCLVAFSGGRDSSYMLHYIKQVLDLNPVAYTYDWGMVTDLARRNQARVCGKLGVEHIIVSADIKKKRDFIRKNINAWLRKPELGMVPLFMAGDKQFFYYNKKLMKQTGTQYVFWGTNPLELCVFKTGFAGAKPAIWDGYYEENAKSGASPLLSRLRLTSYYALQYVTNPYYINSSIFDTAFAYLCSMLIPVTKDMIMFYRFLPYDENLMMKTLIEEYEWECEADTNTTWRIGDGTAAFYNYIYYRVAGVTENDTFRSNQIREGMITRDEALKLIEKENKFRYESLQWYADTIGFDLERALKVIDSIPTLYER